MSTKYSYLLFWSDAHLVENIEDNNELREAKFAERW
jgi:hypothetical protein